MKLEAVRNFAMSLGEVTEEPHHNFSSFRSHGSIFVTVPPDEERIHVFPAEAAREQHLAMYPEFMERLLWGGKVVGVRVSLAAAEPTAVKALVRAAYEFKSLPAAARKRGTNARSNPPPSRARGTPGGA